MGGKPNKATAKDRRLTENKTPGRDTADTTDMPRAGKPKKATGRRR